MIRVKVDKADPTDLYEQVAAAIRRAIAEVKRSLESAFHPRRIAAVLGVNTNTVLRSLRLLRDEGLPEFRRGRGMSRGHRSAGPSSREPRNLSPSPDSRVPRDELVEILQNVS